jgi:hypothetical protein
LEPDFAKSCLRNVAKVGIPEYVLGVCLELLSALKRNQCAPTLSKSVLNAYLAVKVRSCVI